MFNTVDESISPFFKKTIVVTILGLYRHNDSSSNIIYASAAPTINSALFIRKKESWAIRLAAHSSLNGCMLILSLFGHGCNYLAKPSANLIVIFFLMWICTCRAILHTIISIGKTASTLVPQQIKRTITEQAVEIFQICSGMTWKIFAVFMRKKLIIFRSITTHYLLHFFDCI